jgi:hypothetical protein
LGWNFKIEAYHARGGGRAGRVNFGCSPTVSCSSIAQSLAVDPHGIPLSEFRAKKNVAVLAVCQALFNSGGVIAITLGGLVGFNLALDKTLATLPVTMVVVWSD